MLNFLKRLFRPAPAEPPATTPSHPATVVAQHRAEHDLAQAEQRFRLLVEGVQEYAIFMLDPKGNIASWNPGAERIKGYQPHEIIGKHFSVFYPPEDVASGKPKRELEIAVATGKYEEEGWRLRKDGSRFWASVVITGLKDAQGNLQGFAKVTRDMTDRREAEDAARRLFEEETSRRLAESSARRAERAQQDERQQREQLQVTLSSIGDAVIVTDMEGRITFLNPVAAALTGWKPEEAAGQPLDNVFRILKEESRQTVESPVRKALREGVIVGLANHTILIRRDGQETPIDDSAAPIRGEGGTVAGVVLVFRDVTQARRAMETQTCLAAIIESSEDAIIGKDLNGIVTSWNRGAERLYGYTAEEMIGRPLAILSAPEYPDEMPAIMERLKRGELVEHFETVRVRKDGARLNVALTISPIRNAEGVIVGASKIARDITARVRNEASLRFLAEASKRLAALLDVPSTLQKVASLAVPYFADWCAVDLIEPDGSVRRVADAHADPSRESRARELYERYSAERNAPVGFWHVLHSGQSELLEDVTDPSLAGSVRDEATRQLARELGLRSYIGVPLVVRGTVQGVINFVAAESRRTFGEVDLRLAEDLAYRASIAIENARLYADLCQADQRKDEWIAMLAHELRNPLAPIRNALHIMKMPGADGRVIDNARQLMERQVQYMVRLVDDLLDVSRIMRGKIDLRRESVSLANIITRAVEIAQPMVDAQGQELIVSTPPEPLVLNADPTRLAQIVSNLLHNAAKFSTRKGRIWLTVERDTDEVAIRVRDEGAGIRPELLPHIFDLFVQGDRSLERTQGGLGIGLTVVRRLVALHGGTISARSEGPGKGSEFVVNLPGVEQGRQPPAEAPAKARTASGNGSSRRVLVVDDNVDAAESAALLLKMWGHAVQVAYNGPAAVQAADEFQPEIVVLDIGLPGLNGYEVARHLRQQPRKVTLVAVTGYGQEEDRRRTQEAGFDHHLTKPMDPQALRGILERVPK
jgi:PAS domain S-box-containing protein